MINLKVNRLSDMLIKIIVRCNNIHITKLLLRCHPSVTLDYVKYLIRKNAICFPFYLLSDSRASDGDNLLIKEALEFKVRVLSNEFKINCIDIGIIKPVISSNVLMTFHNSAPYDFSGYWQRTSSLLSAIKLADFEVTCATRPGYPWDLQKHRALPIVDCDQVNGTDFYRLSAEDAPYKRGSDFKYIKNYGKQLAELAKLKHCSVIHGHSNFLNGLAAIDGARRAGVYSVYEARGFWHITGLAKNPAYGKTDQFEYESKMEILALKHADKVVTLSGAMKDLIASWGVDSDKVHVIPNGVDVDKFQPQVRDMSLRSKWGNDRFVIGFIGSLTVYEGLSDLIKAVIRLNTKGYPVSLVVAGSGDVEDELQQLSYEHEFIHLVGRILHEEVNNWYSSFDLCAYPRTDDDVCRYVPPMKVLEAMAMEIPVIVSDLAPLTEMVTHNKTGLVCQPSNFNSLYEKIEYAFNHPDLIKLLAQNGRRWVCKHRTWCKNAERYKMLYESLSSISSDKLN